MAFLVRKFPQQDVRTDSTHLSNQGTSFYGLSGLLDAGYQASNAAVLYTNTYFNTPQFKQATVNSSLVPATQSNFPAYVDLSRIGISSLGEALSVRVYSDFAKSVELAREIVSATEMHVKITSLTTTTKLYVEWDDERADYAATATFGRNAVWSSYASVWHLEEGSGTRIDSKAGTNNLTGTTRGAVAATLGNGNDFEEASSDTLSKASPSGLGGISSLSLEVVIKAESLTQALPAVMALWKDDGGSNQRAWALDVITSDANKIRFYVSGNGSAADSLVGEVISLSTVYVITATFITGTNNMNMYINGNTYTKTSTETTIFNSTTDVRIGSAVGFGGAATGVFWDGLIDEARVVASVLSASYHTTKVNNITNEASFWGTWSVAVSGSSFTQTLTETVTHADSMLRQGIKTVIETITSSDALFRQTQKTRTETVTNSDSLIRQIARSLVETVTHSDTLLNVRTFLKQLTETLTHSDTLVKQGQKPLSETVTNSDTLVKQLSRALTETVTNSDTLAAVRTFLKNLTETVTNTDSLSRQTTKLFSEVASLADTLVKQAQKTIANTVTLSDTLLAVKTFLKSLVETVTHSDTLAKQTGKAMADTATMSDSLVKQTQKPIANTITMSDVLAAVKTFLKSLSETVIHTDSLTKQGQKPLSETVTNGDSVVKSTNKTRTESIALADTMLRQSLKSVSETITYTGSLVKQVGKFIVETVTSSDIVNKSTSTTRSESVSYTDAISRTFLRVLSDTYSLTDTLARTLGKVFTETYTLVPSFLSTLFTTALIDPYCQAQAYVSKMASPLLTRISVLTSKTKPYTDRTVTGKRPPKDCP